jgi:hypothetical protein
MVADAAKNTDQGAVSTQGVAGDMQKAATEVQSIIDAFEKTI